ncbi:winged helix-turn-helix domain-containing protein [uncultured Methanobacterium sp.]|uniref:winged helix-turn-helix domain-containing protein n=1 Tax=uncultured Methanobacterium sp. TaxID=176306 RepID=UPI002AA8BEA1|nr:winged helix-turn-helix domain-containing protein [uncultured Methanobacterium sp.]
MANVLREVFGNTKRISILEEMVENWGEFLTIEEIARISETSPKTAYRHINELNKIGILDFTDAKPKKYKLKEDDKRALALAILESEEYLRKAEITLNNVKKEEKITRNYRSFMEFNNSNPDELKKIGENSSFSS